MDKEYKISNDKITVQTAIPFHSLMEMELRHDINAHVILVLRVTVEKESQEEILGRTGPALRFMCIKMKRSFYLQAV